MGRAPCCAKVGLNRGRWTAEEDETLTKYIQTHGEGSWRDLPTNAGLLRCGKSCRLRWINYLRSDLKRGNISEEEEQLIIKLHGLLGNRWSLIAGRMQGRTDNEIKNYWNTHLSRKLADRGINPVTHKPFYCTFSLQPKKDSKPELTSSIESSTPLTEHIKKARETEKPMKKKSTVMTGAYKRKKPWTEKGALIKKKDPMEQLSSRISNQSSCEPSFEMNHDESKLKSQAQNCNVAVEEKVEVPILLQDEHPTSSLSVNSCNLWEESFSSEILPSDMDLFGSFDTEDLIMFDKQLPDSNAADDSWSFFLSNVEESCYPNSLTWILPPHSSCPQ